MKIYGLPEPPNPNDSQYISDTKGYNLAMYRWACNLKSQLQIVSRINDRPSAVSFVPTNYTTATTLTGTDTTTNVAQVLCTLISALITKGVLKSNSTVQ
jgi:hypothetical protein